MNTARIVVLTHAVGADGVAAAPEDMLWQTWPAATASDPFIRPHERPDATAETFARVRQTGTLPPALRRIADINMVEDSAHDALKRSESVGAVRYGIASPTATQK